MQILCQGSVHYYSLQENIYKKKTKDTPDSRYVCKRQHAWIPSGNNRDVSTCISILRIALIGVNDLQTNLVVIRLLQVAPHQITWLPGQSLWSKCNEGFDWCIYVTVVTCADTLTCTLCIQSLLLSDELLHGDICHLLITGVGVSYATDSLCESDDCLCKLPVSR